jgi:hypothetical protein
LSTATAVVRTRTSPNINISTSNPLNTICIGDSINLEANATPGDNVVYSWTPGGATSDSIWVSPTSDSTVYVVTASRFGCSDSTSIDSVTIYSVPHVVAGFTYTVSGLTVTFTNTSQHGNAYTWYYGDGDSSYSTAGTHTHTYPYDNTWTVTLIADTSGYCNDSYTQTITIITTGLQNLSNQNKLLVYPNPSSGRTTVEISLTSPKADLEIVNILGERVVHRSVSTGKNQLLKEDVDLSGLANGVYFIKLKSESEIYVSRFIRE